MGYTYTKTWLMIRNANISICSVFLFAVSDRQPYTKGIGKTGENLLVELEKERNCGHLLVFLGILPSFHTWIFFKEDPFPPQSTWFQWTHSLDLPRRAVHLPGHSDQHRNEGRLNQPNQTDTVSELFLCNSGARGTLSTKVAEKIDYKPAATGGLLTVAYEGPPCIKPIRKSRAGKWRESNP